MEANRENDLKVLAECEKGEIKDNIIMRGVERNCRQTNNYRFNLNENAICMDNAIETSTYKKKRFYETNIKLNTFNQYFNENNIKFATSRVNGIDYTRDYWRYYNGFYNPATESDDSVFYSSLAGDQKLENLCKNSINKIFTNHPGLKSQGYEKNNRFNMEIDSFGEKKIKFSENDTLNNNNKTKKSFYQTNIVENNLKKKYNNSNLKKNNSKSNKFCLGNKNNSIEKGLSLESESLLKSGNNSSSTDGSNELMNDINNSYNESNTYGDKLNLNYYNKEFNNNEINGNNLYVDNKAHKNCELKFNTQMCANDNINAYIHANNNYYNNANNNDCNNINKIYNNNNNDYYEMPPSYESVCLQTDYNHLQNNCKASYNKYISDPSLISNNSSSKVIRNVTDRNNKNTFNSNITNNNKFKLYPNNHVINECISEYNVHMKDLNHIKYLTQGDIFSLNDRNEFNTEDQIKQSLNVINASQDYMNISLSVIDTNLNNIHTMSTIKNDYSIENLSQNKIKQLNINKSTKLINSKNLKKKIMPLSPLHLQADQQSTLLKCLSTRLDTNHLPSIENLKIKTITQIGNEKIAENFNKNNSTERNGKIIESNSSVDQFLPKHVAMTDNFLTVENYINTKYSENILLNIDSFTDKSYNPNKNQLINNLIYPNYIKYHFNSENKTNREDYVYSKQLQSISQDIIHQNISYENAEHNSIHLNNIVTSLRPTSSQKEVELYQIDNHLTNNSILNQIEIDIDKQNINLLQEAAMQNQMQNHTTNDLINYLNENSIQKQLVEGIMNEQLSNPILYNSENNFTNEYLLNLRQKSEHFPTPSPDSPEFWTTNHS